MNQIAWNKIILDEFLELACLTEAEKHVLKLGIAGFSIEQQADMMCMSRSNINVIIRKIRNKYDAVQPYSDKLPPRKKGARERSLE